MQISTTEPENFTLKLSTRNRQGYFVWATINPANWKLLVTGEDPVAVFEVPSEDAFLRGSVYLVPGRRLNGKTEWKTPLSWKRGTSLQINDLTEADRPLSYEVAQFLFAEVHIRLQILRRPWCHEFPNLTPWGSQKSLLSGKLLAPRGKISPFPKAVYQVHSQDSDSCCTSTFRTFSRSDAP
jgi:hypothetical protein